MIRLLLILSLLSLSCGRSSTPDRSPLDISHVAARAELYQSALPADGWIDTEHCDSLIFSGLAGVADLSEAEVSPGVWIRKPLRYGVCSPEAGTSRSTISRDGILGVYWWMWRTGDVAAAERLMLNLRENNYQLRGDGTLGELLLTVNHINTLAHMLTALGSSLDVSGELNLQYLTYFGPGAEGFRRHIMIWHILLRGEIRNELGADELNRIQEHRDAQPENPLHAAAHGKWISGDMGPAVHLLERYYPIDRLPTSRDFCSNWPIERDEAYQKECPEDSKVHTGADLVSIYRLILQDREK